MRVAILSNTNLDLLLRDLSGEHEIYQPTGHGTWVQDLIGSGSALREFAPEVVFLLIDGETLLRGSGSRDQAAAIVSESLAYAQTFLDEGEDVPLFLSTIDVPHRTIATLKAPRLERFAEARWAEGLEALCGTFSRCYPFELKELIELEGRDGFLSEKLLQSGGIRYSMRGHRRIKRRVMAHLNAVAGRRRKMLVVDLDNTLWGGVLGEEGPDGIGLGEHGEGRQYKEFQRRIIELKETGAVLAIASKNNVADVSEVFAEHPDMVLRLDDFVASRVDWEVKAGNLRDIIDSIGIGADAVVFIDDSRVERESVKRELPNVAVPDFPEDSTELSSWMRAIYEEHFLALDVTDEDRQKTGLYQQNQRRDASRTKATTYEAFLESLETRVTLRHATPLDVPRIAQLTQKTNQFNLTTHRYTEADIRALTDDPAVWVFAAEVDDRFGSSGLVSTLIVKRDGDVAHIDTFLLSCRLMSRFVEDAVITAVEGHLRAHGVTELRGQYVPTRKNAPVCELLERLGYSVVSTSPDGVKDYRLELTEGPIEGRQYFAVVVDTLADPADS